jgi:RNA polymerase sigma-70 factor (ECF subfamily)
LTEQEIIEGFISGRKREYNQMTSWITDVVRSKLWTERVAPDDVVADTMEKLLINFRENSFRLESSLKTYVQRITYYTLITALRRERKFSSEPVGEDFPLTGTPTPQEGLENREEEEMFERIVAMLPEKCRQLWEMVFIEKLKSKEMGVKLGMTEGAIRTSLSRCKDKAIEIRSRLT